MQPENPSDEELEIEVTLEPSDSEIQYDPPGAWTSSDGVCTNGTRSTTQLGAKITVKFRGELPSRNTRPARAPMESDANFITLHFRGSSRLPLVSGIEISVSFVPKQENITVSAELNGAPLGEFVIPGQSQSRCQLQDSWNRILPASTNEHQITFTYNNYASSNIGRRAPPALELGQIR